MKRLALAALALVATPALAAPDGAAIFNRCAACHTKTGAGVPGAYPPLNSDFRTLANSPNGRKYLVLAVIKGLNGPITVEGKPFRGMMPAQGLDDASAMAVLNHIGTQVAKAGPAFRPFTLAEVAKARAEGAALSSAQVAALHAGAGGK